MIEDDRGSQIAIVCDHRETLLRSSAIVCDRDRRGSHKIEPCSISCDCLRSSEWPRGKTARGLGTRQIMAEKKREFVEEVARCECICHRNSKTRTKQQDKNKTAICWGKIGQKLNLPCFMTKRRNINKFAGSKISSFCIL